jgi:hypothetical protein
MKSYTTRQWSSGSRYASRLTPTSTQATLPKLEYKNLDINGKINLKGLMEAWSDITIERFQKQQDKKIYARRRSSKKRKLRRSYQLRNDWRSRIYKNQKGGGISGLMLSFSLYGRFDDLGVGKGVDAAEALYRKTRKNGDKLTRKPSRWYSREKGYQVHRMRELLQKYYVNVTLDSLEDALVGSVTVHI